MDDTFMTRSEVVTSKGRRTNTRSPKNTALLARTSLGSRKYHFVAKDPNKFGNFSPSWTIPSSRHESRSSLPTPGPGAYDVKILDDHAPSFTIAPRPERDYTTVTSNIGFIDECTFPNIRPHTIGSRIPVVYGDPNIKAELVYPYHDENKLKKYKIGERRPPPPQDKIPGPADYDPVDPSKPRSKGVTLPKMTNQEVRSPLWNIEDVPGPGSYSISQPILVYTNWANRLVPKNRRYKPPEKANAVSPWVVKKDDRQGKKFIEFETLEPTGEKADDSNANTNPTSKK